MRIISRLFVPIFLFLFAVSCSSSNNLKFVKSDITVDIQRSNEFTLDKSVKVEKIDIDLNNASIRYVDYFSRYNSLFINYSDPSEKRFSKNFISYINLKTPSVKWSIKTGSDFITEIEMTNESVVGFYKSYYDIKSGYSLDSPEYAQSFINDITTKLISENDSLENNYKSITQEVAQLEDTIKSDNSKVEADSTLVLTKEKFSLIDKNSGETIWQRLSHDWSGVLYYRREGDWVLAYANGIEAFKYNNGKGWYKKVDLQKPVSSLRTLYDKLYSPPIVEENNVFIVTKKSVMCLNIENGDVLWETELEHDLGRSATTFSMDGNLFFFSFGYDFEYDFNYRQKIKSNVLPYVLKLRLNDGTVLVSKEFDKNYYFNEWYKLSNFLLLAGPNQIITLDDNLNKTGHFNFDKNDEYRRLLEPGNNSFSLSHKGMRQLSDRFVNGNSTSPIYLKTQQHVFCLSMPTLEKKWQYNLGNSNNYVAVRNAYNMNRYLPGGLEFSYSQLMDIINSRIDKNIFWFVGSEGLVGINIYNGNQVEYSLPFKNSRYYFKNNDEFVHFKIGGNTATILNFSQAN